MSSTMLNPSHHFKMANTHKKERADRKRTQRYPRGRKRTWATYLVPADNPTSQAPDDANRTMPEMAARSSWHGMQPDERQFYSEFY